MKTVDFGSIIVTYNLIIGLLLMISSEKISVFAGYLIRSHKVQAMRITKLTVLTFGLCVAVLSAGIYLSFYIL